MHYFEQIWALFQTQSKQRKISLVIGMVIIIVLTSTLMIWALAPSYGVLFSRLDKQDANQILTQLEQANISYQVRNDGRDILIDQQLIDKTRIKLMGSDVPFAHNVGFELFDKTDFGMTDFSQKINYQRALQGELERTISSLDEVKQARVQLTIPENHLFQQESNPARVAVTLHLNQTLTPLQVRSIQQLVMASIANLAQANVVIVDQNGNGLTQNDDDTNTTHFAAKKNIEHYLNEKVMQMLAEVFTDERVMVKIDATLNYDELQRERVNPQQHGLITHEKEVRHSITNKTGKAPTNQDITQEKTYKFGREKEQFTRANGTIERLTISVVVPQQTNKETVLQIERLVKSVVGFDAKRGDSISVEALAKTTITPPIVQPLTKTPSSMPWAMSMGGVLFVLLVIMVRNATCRIRQRQRLLDELNLWLLEHD